MTADNESRVEPGTGPVTGVNGRGSSVPAVRVEGLVKRFGATVALDGAGLEVPAGMVQWLSPKHGDFAAEPEALAGRNAAERVRGGAGWRIGQSVKHSRFGLGIIIDAEGRGTDARVQVNFRDGGVKWLALEYAKLQPA